MTICIESAKRNSNGNLLSIQFLRFLAAMLVVLFHSEEVFGLYWPHIVTSASSYVYGAGAAGVHVFFVISGFVMVYQKSHSPIEFLYRRLVRIFPIYWVYAALYLSVYEMKGLDLLDGLKSLLLLPPYSSRIIGQGWTLSYELYFYLCFAMTMRLRNGLAILTIFFLLSIAVRVVFHTTGPTLDLITNSLLLEFLMGAWLAKLMLLKPQVSDRQAISIIAIGILGFAFGLWFGYYRLPSVLMWGIPSALIVCGMMFLEHFLPKTILSLSFLGDSSYSLYLLHPLLLAGMTNVAAGFFSPDPDFRDFLCVAFSLLCCAVALMAYQLLERPLTSFLKFKTAAIPNLAGIVTK